MPGVLAASPDNSRARMALALTGFPDEDTVVYRWLTGASEGVPVRSANPVRPVGGSAQVFDYEMPLNTGVYYTAHDGTATRTTSTVTVTSSQAWLKVPSQPEMNVAVLMAEMPTVTRASRQSTFPVIGRPDPIVVADVRSSQSGTLTFITLSDDEASSLDLLFSQSLVAYLQIPHHRFGSQYLALGEVTETPVTGKRFHAEATWSVEYQVVSSPPGGAVGDLTGTWQQMLDTYPTWGDVLTGEDSWLDVLGGVGI